MLCDKASLSPVSVIGLGIGRPALGKAAAAALAEADLLVGGTRQLAAFPEHSGEKCPLVTPLARTLELVTAAVRRGRKVAVLADGDPLYFGIGSALLQHFGPDHLLFFPNVTAVATAAARLGRPWQDVPVVSLHGRSDRTPLWAALAGRDGRAVVLTDAVSTPAVLAAAVAERAGDRFAVTVLEDLGLPDENVRRLSLKEAAKSRFSPLNVTFFEATQPPEVALALGLDDNALERADGVYTKATARAVILSALSPRPGNVIFDIGAGVGTVAIEASLLNPGGPVFAVEADPDRAARLERNIRRTGALTVEPIPGQAPRALADLPDPDRVFVGGGLSADPKLLTGLAGRLRPGGRLVVAAVLLGSIEAARHTLSTRPDLALRSQVLVQASQAVPLAGDRHYKADNPVCVLTAIKEDRP